MQQPYSIDPVTRHVRGLSEKFWLQREAAELLGISRRRLRRLGRLHPDECGHGAQTEMGDVRIHLYSEEDVDRIKVYLGRVDANLRRQRGVLVRRGPKPIWSDEETEDRHRRRVNARYHRNRAEELDRQGLSTVAAKNWARSRYLTQQLEHELAERLADLPTHRRRVS